MHGREQGMEIEVGRRIGLLGLDPGDVQDVADHLEQGLTGAAHGLHHVALGVLERGAAQQVGHADDRVQGRAQLVAHGRKEPALGPVGGLRPVERVGQPDQEGRGVGRQQQEGEPEARRKRRLAPPIPGQRDHQGEAGQAQQRRDEQIAAAIAEPHPERDPEIKRIEHGRRRLPDGQRHRQGHHVEGHAGVAPRRARSRSPQQMAEQEQRAAPDRRPRAAGNAPPGPPTGRRRAPPERDRAGRPRRSRPGSGPARARCPGAPADGPTSRRQRAAASCARGWSAAGSAASGRRAWTVMTTGGAATGGRRRDRGTADLARIATGVRRPSRPQPEATAGRSRPWNKT